MSGEYDDLFLKPAAGADWWSNAEPEVKAWMEGLAAEVKKRGRKPSSWKDAYTKCHSKFPEQAPSSDTTFRKYMNQLLDG